VSKSRGIPKQTHTGLVKACIQWLTLKGCTVWSNNSGFVVIPGKPGRKRRAIRFGHAGSSDIIGFVSHAPAPLKHHGLFVAVECKIPPDVASDEQDAFLLAVFGAGGFAYAPESLEDLEMWWHADGPSGGENLE